MVDPAFILYVASILYAASTVMDVTCDTPAFLQSYQAAGLCTLWKVGLASAADVAVSVTGCPLGRTAA